ncbi:hypothetical protein ACN28S_09475 [Cystobacter fuscus]
MKAWPGAPGLEALLEDAGKVPASSPAGVTVAYYSGHLLRELGRADEARQRLAQITPEMTADQVSTDNLLRGSGCCSRRAGTKPSATWPGGRRA